MTSWVLCGFSGLRLCLWQSSLMSTVAADHHPSRCVIMCGYVYLSVLWLTDSWVAVMNDRAVNISVCDFCWILLWLESEIFPTNLMYLTTGSSAGAATLGSCGTSKGWSLARGSRSLEMGRLEADIHFWFWPKLSASWSANTWLGQSASFLHQELNLLGSPACPVMMDDIPASSEPG